MEPVWISYLGIPVLPVYCPALHEDCEDTGLHARMPVILNTHKFEIMCNRVARVQSFSDFGLTKCGAQLK